MEQHRMRGDVVRKTVSALAVVIVALGFGSVFVILSGGNPAVAYWDIVIGSLGDPDRLAGTLVLTSILIFTGLSVALPFKGGIWNIGSEGQLYLGAVGGFAAYLFKLDPVLTVIFAALFGVGLGALWGAVAGLLKTKFRVDEIVSTIMLNYIAFYIVDYLAGGPWRAPRGTYRYTLPIEDSWRFPILIPGTHISSSLLIAVLAVVATYIVMFRTKTGFQIRLMGSNVKAAKYAGVSVNKMTILLMMVGGALAGLAGVSLVYALTFVLFLGISQFYGYLGIAVAALGDLYPLVIPLTAIFFAMLETGGQYMQQSTGMLIQLVQIVSATIVIIVTLRPLIARYRSRSR